MPTDTTHPVFQPRQPNDDRIKVWRYMNLPKFIRLLQSRALYLARADTLGDPFEGSITEINRLANEKMVTRMLAYSDGRYTRDDLQKMRSNSNVTIRQSTYVSCWYSGETENATMWKAYGADSCGVVVQSTYDKLRDNLPGPETEGTANTYYIGCIKYLDYQGSDWIGPGGNSFSPYIHKRREFEGEREVRIICQVLPASGMGIVIPIDTGRIIDDIRAYPGAPMWTREMLTELVRLHGLELDVSPSRLDAIPNM